jgi:hypothetical protein
MWKYALSCLAGAFAGGLLVWSLQDEATAADQREEGRALPQKARRGAQSSGGSEPTTLSECRQVVARQEFELRAARASTAREVAKELFDGEDLQAAASSRSRSLSEPEGGAETRDSTKTERQRYREASQKVQEALVSQIGISEDEEAALADVVCTPGENERSLYLEYGDGTLNEQDLFDSIAHERASMMDGMQRTLGVQRLRKLRAVGGVGILARRLCQRR